MFISPENACENECQMAGGMEKSLVCNLCKGTNADPSGPTASERVKKRCGTQIGASDMRSLEIREGGTQVVYQTSREISLAARTKSLNSGCGSNGFDFSSG